MGRFRSLPAADDRPEPDVASEATPSESDGDVIAWTPPVALDADRVRLDTLRRVRVKLPSGPQTAAAVEVAARLWLRTPAGDARSDRKRMPMVVYALVADAELHGDIDARRALKRSVVDRYLDALSVRRATRSMRAYRSTLYAVGRILHPREFPLPRAIRAERTRAQPAASEAQVRRYYALVPMVSPVLRPRLEALLDLTTGAGLRAAEIRDLRGTDITVATIDGLETVVIRVGRLRGGTRSVPVIHPAKAARLRRSAERAGDAYLLPSAASGGPIRHVASRISEDLVRAGFERIDAAALRNRWILELAQRIPAVLLLQLADLGDARVLADQAELLPTFDLADATTMLRGAAL